MDNAGWSVVLGPSTTHSQCVALPGPFNDQQKLDTGQLVNDAGQAVFICGNQTVERRKQVYSQARPGCVSAAVEHWHCESTVYARADVT